MSPGKEGKEGKGKKRVGFQEEDSPTSPGPSLETSGPDTDPFGTPALPESPPVPIQSNIPDPQALKRALSEVLEAESPRRPRPVLRRNSSYDRSPEPEGHQANTGERQQRSERAARERADRLAVDLGGYSSSAPVTRRSSAETLPSPNFIHLYEGANDPIATGLEQPSFNSPMHRKASRRAAEKLVMSHTNKPQDRQDLFTQRGLRSGQVTPTEERGLRDFVDYVPRPERYHGGILSSLLRLYDGKTSGSGSSGNNTPMGSPPTSGAATPLSSRPSSGLFPSLGRTHASNSSLTLGELMKQSSMFAAPGSGDITGVMSEKLKERPKHKRRRSGLPNQPKQRSEDKYRITVHIAEIMSRHRYLVKLCKALMMYGAPTHRLEEYMTMSSRVLEIEGQFLYIPGCMIISFDDSSTHTAEVKLVRAAQGVDLGRLRDVHEIYKEVVHDRIGVDEATLRLDEVMKAKPKFSTWLRVPVYGLASVCVAPFAFEGRFIDLPIAFILGCVVGIMQLVLATSSDLYSNVFEISAAVATSFLARAFGSIQYNGSPLFCFSALAQSSIALILPGYMVLCSSLELQSHNIVAGSVRMVYAMIYTLFLGYGIMIGTVLYGIMDKNAASDTHCDAPLERPWYFLFVPLFTLCLCVINQAKWKQTPVMVVIAVAGFAVNTYSSTYFVNNSQISNTLGALTVGLLANLYSRVGRHIDFSLPDTVSRLAAGWRRRCKGQRPGPGGIRATETGYSLGNSDDVEMGAGAEKDARETEARKRKDGGGKEKVEGAGAPVGYGLAAAAMLPAIFVQVPSGLAAGGSLLSGINSANQITGNSTVTAGSSGNGGLDGTAFNVLLSVIQVAIGITVGLFLSALLVYPLGKRRSGLFSF